MKVGVGGLQGNGVEGQVCPKVLVVEDEPLIRLDAASYLAEADSRSAKQRMANRH